MYLLAVAILFLLLLPFIIVAKWLVEGTNVNTAPFVHKFVVGVHAGFGIVCWGLLLVSVLLVPFEHQQMARAAAANMIHPAGSA
jgi:hypothetical protein